MNPEQRVAPGPVRVGVVDDHPAIVDAISRAIDSSPDLVLVGSGTSMEDAARLLELVDVLVCDVQLAGHAEGLGVTERARRAPGRPAVLLLSGFGHGSVIRAAIEVGASGYLDKSEDLGSIVDAVRTVAAGGTVFRAADLELLRSARRRPSERELAVIAGVASGATNAELARLLGVSEKTVESHLHRLFDRYGALSRTELAVLALTEGWITDPARGSV
jgi:DNA-binding NarL/FixJ family response regulator